MNRSFRYVVLSLTFALVFVGCSKSDQRSNAPTLQRSNAKVPLPNAPERRFGQTG